MYAEVLNRQKGSGMRSTEGVILCFALEGLPLFMTQHAMWMQATWRLKEEDAERLVRAAVARSERPWLILLTVLSGISASLLAIVLWQVQRMP